MRRFFFITTFFVLTSPLPITSPPPPNGLAAQIWTCGTPGTIAQVWDMEVEGDQPTQIRMRGYYNATLGSTLALTIAGGSSGSYLSSNATTGSAAASQSWLVVPVSDTRFSSFSSSSSSFSSWFLIQTNATANTGTPYCLTVLADVIGSPLFPQACVLSNPPPSQLFAYDAATGTLRSAAVTTGEGACLDAVTTISCTDSPLSTYPYCDPDIDTQTRVADLVSRMGPADYAILLSSTGAGVPRLGIPAGASTFGECLHGTWANGAFPYTNTTTNYTSTGAPTSFPHLMALASSFNRTLWTLVAGIIGDEDIALRNQRRAQGQGITPQSMYFSPHGAMCRYPTWGRCQEVPGEDPVLSSEFVAVYGAALQEGPDSRYKKVVATCKHSAAYDLDNLKPTGSNITRFDFTAEVGLGDLVSYYLPPFRSCVQRAKVGGIMCSYNSLAVDGGPSIPSCANDFLHASLLREEWGFDGLVVTDCGAFSLICSPNCYTYNRGHNFTTSLNATVRVAVGAGIDTACDPQFALSLVPALANGDVTMAQLAVSATRVLTQAFSTGLADPPDRVPYFSYGPERVDTPQARTLAYEAAVQGAVLLKNDGNTLPLQAKGLRKVAVVGPNAAVTQGLLSNYHGDTPVVNNQSILAGIQRIGTRHGFAVTTAPGCLSIACTNSSGFPAALDAVQGANVAIVVLGLCSQSCIASEDNAVKEEEMFDRITLLLPGQQEALLQAVAASGVPQTILVLVHGGPLDVSWADASSKVSAIVSAHYPGEMGGDAIAALLFGDVSPSGRMTITTYREAYLAQRTPTDMSLAPHADPHTGKMVPGITYLYFDGPEVLYPFGWGLSYTTFSYAWLNAGSNEVAIDADDWAKGITVPPAFAVNVTNTGSKVSDVSVLAFLSTGQPGDPLQELFDFQRTAALSPGQTVTLYFTVPAETAARVTQQGEVMLHPGTVRVWIGDVEKTGKGNSGVEGRLVVVRRKASVADNATPVMLFNASAVAERSKSKITVGTPNASKNAMFNGRPNSSTPSPFIANVLAYGAVNDGHTLCTVAVRAAAAAVVQAGGGTLYFPPGKYLTAPFNLSVSNSLLLLDNAVIIATTDFTQWPLIAPLPSYGQGRDHTTIIWERYSAFIGAYNVSNWTLTTNSSGTIDGQGYPWWVAHDQGTLCCTPGHLLEVAYSNHVVIGAPVGSLPEALTLMNSPFWTVHPYSSNDLWIHDVNIIADPTYGNNDGVDPDSCSNVLIERVSYVGGDDGVVIKSGWNDYGIQYGVPSVNITVKNCLAKTPGACFAIGSEMSGGVENVTVTNLTCIGSGKGFNIKSAVGRGAYVRNIVVTNSTLVGVECAIQFYLQYADPPDGKPINASEVPQLSGFVFDGIVGSGIGIAGEFNGTQKIGIRDVLLTNVDLGEVASTVPWFCTNVTGNSRNVQPVPCPELPPP